jgi:hypothetical protein
MYEIGRYDFPEPEHFVVWYECKKRHRAVSLEFLRSFVDQRDITRALKVARDLDTDALLITRNDSPERGDKKLQKLFQSCAFRQFQPRFNSTLPATCLVDHNDLILERYLKDNVAVVRFQDERFVYKFMNTTCLQDTFETEERNYQKLAGVAGIPQLKAAVRKDGVVHGLLIPYIEGDDLWSVATTSSGVDDHDSGLLNITYGIISLAAMLEKQRHFYHQDLKCSNIVRRTHDGELFFVDLAGGLTKGMYRPEREGHILRNGFDAADAVFSLGRTVWSLWNGRAPATAVSVDAVRDDTVRDIVTDCEEGRVGCIGALYEKYVPIASR